MAASGQFSSLRDGVYWKCEVSEESGVSTSVLYIKYPFCMENLVFVMN